MQVIVNFNKYMLFGVPVEYLVQLVSGKLTFALSLIKYVPLH